jgi:hypothetical protein
MVFVSMWGIRTYNIEKMKENMFGGSKICFINMCEYIRGTLKVSYKIYEKRR